MTASLQKRISDFLEESRRQTDLARGYRRKRWHAQATFAAREAAYFKACAARLADLGPPKRARVAAMAPAHTEDA